MGVRKMYINGVLEQRKDQLIRQSLLSDEFLDFVKTTRPELYEKWLKVLRKSHL